MQARTRKINGKEVHTYRTSARRRKLETTPVEITITISGADVVKGDFDHRRETRIREAVEHLLPEFYNVDNPVEVGNAEFVAPSVTIPPVKLTHPDVLPES